MEIERILVEQLVKTFIDVQSFWTTNDVDRYLHMTR